MSWTTPQPPTKTLTVKTGNVSTDVYQFISSVNVLIIQKLGLYSFIYYQPR